MISSKKDFLKTLERERARSDRTGHDFSIIIFNITKSGSQKALSIQTLADAIRKKIHCCDDMGWFDKHKLGILLPHTNYGDAAKLAADISSAVFTGECLCEYNILTYPFHWINPIKSPAEKIAPEDMSTYSSLNAWALANENLTKHAGVSPGMPLWKRLMDIAGSGIGILLLLPVFALLAAYIKIISPGPVFFTQRRVGFLGKPFICLKFRTMHVNTTAKVHNNYFSMLMSSDVPMQKLDDKDPRILPFGTLLRKLGLDELPQLFNVLKGDMSLIGPRPCIPYEAEEYKIWQRRRFDAVPGLTGLWQVSGKNRTTFNQMMRYDINYAGNTNFLLDTKILLKTIPAIIDQVAENKKIRSAYSSTAKLSWP
ncbi:MAG: sugar transferase [Pseudomonadota bacterium]